MIGPWVHTLESSGDLEYPNSNVLSMLMIKEATAWFNHQLKGLPYPYRKGGVEAYIIGEERWENWNGGLPRTGSQRYYLNTSQDANASSGQLTREAPTIQETITYTYDPLDPVPTRGESACSPGPLVQPIRGQNQEA
ncbi:hypothetical protein ccbrp13_62780 [Ktedonobacteria bacterium brp13]|nr:hypothetical protein ccbrp13_62780 [Ktedonobacteria bacterium brp13]